MLVVAMDANFRLKSRLRGTINKEPTLGLGWSYFVNNGPYSDFIKDYVDQEEVGLMFGRDSIELTHFFFGRFQLASVSRRYLIC
jgi:hypothetical protein